MRKTCCILTISILLIISVNSGAISNNNDSYNCSNYCNQQIGGAIIWGWWWPEFPGRYEPFFNVEDITQFIGGTTAIATADFNNDGFLDVVLKWYNGPWDDDFRETITIIYNIEDGTSLIQEDVYSIDYARIKDMNAKDYDGDGDIDILFTYSEFTSHGSKRNGTGYILYNNGNNEFTTTKNVFFHGYDPDKPRYNPHVTSADFDNDGDIDFLVGDNSGLVAFYKNDGTGEFIHVCDSDFDGRTISWGLDASDYDNDGDIDFIVTGKEAVEVGSIFLKYNDGSEDCFSHENYDEIIDLAVWNYESFYASQYPIADGCIKAIDYNNDGLKDILFGGAGNLYLFIQQNNGGFEQFTIARFPGEKTETKSFTINNLREGGITVGDFNNDGLDDAMIGGSYGTIRSFYNTKTLIDIVYPDWSCIIRNGRITQGFFPLYLPLKHGTSFVTGDLTILAEELEPLSKVEFYLDNELVFSDENSPFEWEWDSFSFGRHTVKAVAYDFEGIESGFDEAKVWKFL